MCPSSGVMMRSVFFSASPSSKTEAPSYAISTTIESSLPRDVIGASSAKGGENCKCRAAEVEPISCGVLCDGNSESGRLRHQAFESRRLWTRSNPQCIWVEVSEHGWQSTDVVAMGVRQRNGIQMGKAS